ncbi:MAG: fasciclin domain-containing protein [Actinobacteria bacterium]|nr:fasciclin domain-containing protein [Actinomycetota bacterium]
MRKLPGCCAASWLEWRLAACGGDDEATEDTAAEVTEDTMAEEAMPAEAGDIVAVGPFTVFAPTNAAFEALPAGLLEKLLLPENVAALTAILTYHVVSGQVMSTDVTAGDVATVEGSTIAITTDGGVKVNGANVVAVDVAASNGVIHVIDQVIVPPTVDVASL